MENNALLVEIKSMFHSLIWIKMIVDFKWLLHLHLCVISCFLWPFWRIELGIKLGIKLGNFLLSKIENRTSFADFKWLWIELELRSHLKDRVQSLVLDLCFCTLLVLKMSELGHLGVLGNLNETKRASFCSFSATLAIRLNLEALNKNWGKTRKSPGALKPTILQLDTHDMMAPIYLPYLPPKYIVMSQKNHDFYLRR